MALEALLNKCKTTKLTIFFFMKAQNKADIIPTPTRKIKNK
jgi:hypothetical protein